MLTPSTPGPYRREPRTVLVKTANFFGAFAFSGRYEYSVGISFSEMAAALKAIIKKINVGENLEQVISLDGGSGAKICLVKNGKPEALNWVAPGFRNRMGDPNGNTYSCLMLKIAD
ncbi:MAG: hypothetical protein HY877_02315 [Deltaproteobacteria bacterium]|nr:hypothetical protein [Deltaproteobacteria bacterium]